MQATVANHAMRALVNFIVHQGQIQQERGYGIERQQVLAEIGCTDAELNNNEQFFAVQQYEKLLAYGSQVLSLPNIGFVHGQAVELSLWGLLGHIVAASPTLWDALSYQKRYQCLLGNAGMAYHEIDGEQVTMRWLSEPNVSANNIEHVITAWIAFAFNYTHTNDKPVSVHFTHSPLVDTQEYEEFFGCKVEFNAEFNGVKVQLASFSTPLTAFNEEVLSVLCCHAEQKLAAKRAAGSLDVIRQYIIDTLPEHVPDLPEVAEHMGLSVRQLQRKFQQQQTNLTEFITHIRRNLAIAYLQQSDHKLLHISQLLGYSEQSAFQRAFKRWYGLTPQEFRIQPVILVPVD